MEGLYDYEIRVPTNASDLLCSPWLFSERVKGESVQPVNGYFLYTLGSVANLFAMTDGVLASAYDGYVSNAIRLLTAFKDAEQNIRNLPDSVDGSIALIEVLQWIRTGYQQTPNVLMNVNVRMAIAHATNRFQTLLAQELGKSHTYILEEKRGYSPKILVREIAKVLPKQVLPYLSAFTVTNLQDAGAAMAFDHFTSCGFLTMRAVEDVSRYYYELISGSPASGVNRNDERWFLTFGQIAWKLGNEILPNLRTTHTPTGKLGLVVPTMAALNEIYRNPLAHPEIVQLEEDDP
jgi:hypothetical protein